jgi:outer membrane receptor protein involved in Fe transport
MTKTTRYGGVASAALATALAAAPALAQDQPGAGPRAQDSPIIVTAEKREQLLIEVPQAISVVGGATLEAQQATNFSDYLKLVPGLQLDQSRAGQGRLIIRGVNTDSVASTVGVYMDETPFGSSSGLVNGAVLAGDFDTFDLDRIEVLRGPQGTIYGASSLSGVLKFVTREPSTDVVELRGRASVETTAGGEASYLGNFAVNLPLSEQAAFRASGFYRNFGGYVDSIGLAGSDTEDDINDTESYGGRASLLFRPSEMFDIRLTAVLQNINADSPGLIEVDPDTLENNLHGGELVHTRYAPEFSNLRYRVYNATANADLGFGTLTSSTSYSTQKQRLQSDYSFALSGLIEAFFGSPNDFFQTQKTDSEKFTQELRLSGESDTIDWLVGGYYTDEKGLIEQDFIASTPGTVTPIAGVPALGYAVIDSKYEEIAGFANLTVHLGDRFEIGLGGRYSANNQTADQLTDGALVGGLTQLPTAESDEEVFTYSIAPRFELSEDASLYARVAKGFRPGGPNVLAPGAPIEFRSYDSDSIVSYEVGLKAQSGMFSADISAFYIDWTNIQLLTSQGGFNFNANGGKAKSEGIEFSATVKPVAGLNLSLNGALTNAKLTEDTEIGGLDGDRLPFTPKFAVSLLADYSWMVSDMAEAHIGGSLRHLSSQSAGFDETFRLANGHQRIVPSYEVIDLSAGVDFGQFSIDAYVRNLGNSHGRSSSTGIDVFGGFPLYPSGAIATGITRPRTFGVTLGVEL